MKLSKNNKEEFKKGATYGHSFSPEFYGDAYDARKVDVPTNVADAIASMPRDEWNEMAEEVFGVSGDVLEIVDVMDKIIETDTVGDLASPVDVWIDEEGNYTVDVFDEGTESQEEGFKEYWERFGDKNMKKISQELFQTGITDDDINKLVEMLKESNLPQNKIDLIKNTLEEGKPTATTSPEAPATNTTQTVLQPGKVLEPLKSANKIRISIKDIDK